MSKDYGDLGDFTFDDDVFAEGAGVNKITEAYSKVFEKIEEIAREAKEVAQGGSSKEISAFINKITHRSASLVELSQLDKKIVGPNGKIFNIIGQELDEDAPEDMNDTLDENELIQRINAIVDGISDISLDDAVTAADEANITDDGLSHGDLDDLNW